MGSENFVQGWISRRAAGVICVAAAFFYFLIFIEMAFLDLLRSSPAGWSRIQSVQVVVTLSAVLGGALAASFFRPERHLRALTILFRFCALVAIASLAVPLERLAYLMAFVVGLGFGFLSIVLVATLRTALNRARLGMVVGLGVGVAYALCNVPWLYAAPEAVQAVFACIAVLVGSLVSGRLKPKHGAESGSEDYEPRILCSWILVFLVLITMDSAAHALFQHEASLRALRWNGGTIVWFPVFIHCAAAVFAGRLLDKGVRASLVLAAFGLLVMASLALVHPERTGVLARYFHVAGVSLYTVGFLYFAAKGGRPWIIVLLFSLSGWLGLSLGAGLVQACDGVPFWFILAAGVILVSALVFRWQKVGRFRRGA